METYVIRFKKLKNILIFWTLFIGIGAVAGSIGFFSDPTGKAMGMDTILQAFQVLPFADILFQNYIFAGISLLIVNGLTNLSAAILLFAKKKEGIIMGMIFGFTLMLWIIIQFCIFETNLLDIAFFIFGLLQLIAGIACYIYYLQVKFQKSIDYTSYAISKKSDTLVVYFSRMNNTKKIAYETATQNNAEILEITTSEKTNGTLGFLWCGRFGMHKWPMKINTFPHDLSNYNKIIIISPVWVFTLSAPIKGFLIENKDKLNNIEFKLVHFANFKYEYLFDEIETLTEKKLQKKTSITVQVGKTIREFTC